jgi:hypothetical protein
MTGNFKQKYLGNEVESCLRFGWHCFSEIGYVESPMQNKVLGRNK